MIAMTITKDQRNTINDIAEQLELELVIAFGSAAKGYARGDSDLDIAVLTKKRPDAALFRRLFDELSTVFPSQNVDLRFLNEADPLFTMQVVKNGLLLSGSNDRFIEYKCLANRLYVDDGMKYFPFQEQLLELQQQRLREAA